MREDGRTWVRVKEATLHRGAGNSIFKHWLRLGSTWELLLEDGRTVMRAVRYPPQKGKRTKRGWNHRRDPDEALPPPKRVLVPALESKDESE